MEWKTKREWIFVDDFNSLEFIIMKNLLMKSLR